MINKTNYPDYMLHMTCIVPFHKRGKVKTTTKNQPKTKGKGLNDNGQQ